MTQNDIYKFSHLNGHVSHTAPSIKLGQWRE